MDNSVIYDREYVSDIVSLLIYERNNGVRNGFYDYTQTSMSYHSNRIEGSPLTYADTWEIYDKGEVRASSVSRVQDITDAQGHFLMFDEMLSGISLPVNEDMVCEWHRELKSGSYMDRKRHYAIGEYKRLENSIGGLIQTVPVDEVEDEMISFFDRYRGRAELGHTIESLAVSHQYFEHIHPFQDGNGRVGRMLLYRQCIDARIVPAVITEELSDDYKGALRDMTYGDDDGKRLSEVFAQASLQYRQESEKYIAQYRKSGLKESDAPLPPARRARR